MAIIGFFELSQADHVNGGEYTGTPASFEIYRSDTPGEWGTDLTRENVRADWGISNANVGYIDAVNGDNANDGEEMSQAKETIEGALDAGFRIIYMAPGNYFPWDWNDATYTALSFALIGVEKGTVRIGYLDGFGGDTYTQDATYPHLREMDAQGNITTVIRTDLKDEWGAPMMLANVGSAAICSTTTESYYKAGTPSVGTFLTNSGGDPLPIAYSTEDIYTGCDDNAAANTWYFENINFYGQTVYFKGSTADQLCFSHCELAYALKNSSNDLLTILGIGEVLLYETNLFYSHQKDLANYHQNGANDVNAYEVNCTMVGAGIIGSTGSPPPNQASTMHDGGKIVRINGTYALSYQGIADTNSGTESWNLGCKFLNNSYASVWSLDSAVMNIDTCFFSGNPSNSHLNSDGAVSGGSPVINYVRTNGYSQETSGSGTIVKGSDGSP